MTTLLLSFGLLPIGLGFIVFVLAIIMGYRLREHYEGDHEDY